MTRSDFRARAREMKREMNKAYDSYVEQVIKELPNDIKAAEPDYAFVKNFVCAVCNKLSGGGGYGPHAGNNVRKHRATILRIERNLQG